jgi:transcriptional regulator with XRE-family HTH domain
MEKTIYTREYGAVIRLLQAARQKAGVTQVDLARELGLTQSQVSKIERGETRLDIIQLRRVCCALGLTLAEFVRRLERELTSGTK